MGTGNGERHTGFSLGVPFSVSPVPHPPSPIPARFQPLRQSSKSRGRLRLPPRFELDTTNSPGVDLCSCGLFAAGNADV